jgi:hypothetical protein
MLERIFGSNEKKKVNTSKPPHVPVGVKVHTHDESMGEIEWNKNDFVKVPFLDDEDVECNMVFAGTDEKSGKLHLNSNILDFLIENPKEIPKEWNGKKNPFLGTVYIGKVISPSTGKNEDQTYVKVLNMRSESPDWELWEHSYSS